MNGRQWLRAAQAWARRNSEPFEVDATRGKGGHKVAVSRHGFTVIKSGEISIGLHKAMLKQLRWPTDAF